MSMTYYAVTDDPNELAHWGVKGMRWGVRHDKPRHSGSRSNRPRSIAYKKAQSKLGKMMRSGIKKAEAHWKEYNSPKAKEERFMKKAMQQARTGTLKYGKLTDAQVRRITDRLALERNARQLGGTENPKFGKRLKTAIGTGIVTGIGAGTTAYIEERFRGRGRTTAELKADKRKAKYESDQKIQQRKARNKVNQEYYEEAARRGYEPTGLARIVQDDSDRAKKIKAWKADNAREEERAKRQNAYLEGYYRTYGQDRAKSNAARKASLLAQKHGYTVVTSTTKKGDDSTTTVSVIGGSSTPKASSSSLPSVKKTPPQRYQKKRSNGKKNRRH